MTTQTRFIQEICRRCSAEIAYSIPEPDVGYLKGYYQSDTERIDPILQDFANQIPEAKSYGVAISSSLVCLSAADFSDSLDKGEAMQYFMSAKKLDQNTPEIFGDLDSDDEFISIVNNGSNYVSLSIEETTSKEYSSIDKILLNLLYVYYYFDESQNYTSYQGNATIKSENYTFSIQASYDRVKNTEFSAIIAINETFVVSDLAAEIAYLAHCEDITPPRGVSSFNEYPVQDLALDFIYNATTEEMQLTFEKIRFDAYDYAIAPKINLNNVDGFIVIEYDGLECGYETVGEWDFGEYIISLTVYDKNTTKEMQAIGSFLEIQSISFTEIDTNFYQVLFPEGTELFPKFSPEDPAIIKDFQSLTITSPTIQLYFQPDTGFNIYGNSSSGGVEVIANRIDDVIECVVHSFTSNSEYAEMGYDFLEQGIYYASSAINIEEFDVMASVFDQNRTDWLEGLWLEIKLEFNDQCEDNAFCALLKENSDAEGDELRIEGYILDEVVMVDYPISDFEIATGVEYQEASLMIEYSSTGALPSIIGVYYFQADSHSFLRVESTIRQGQDMTALVSGESYQIWSQSLDVDYFTFLNLFLNITILPSGAINSTVATGDAVVGGSCFNGTAFTQGCVKGTVKLDIDLQNYLYNSLILYLYNLTTIDFYNVILGYDFSSPDDIPLPYNTLSFPTGLLINYTYSGSFELTGGVQFSGVYSQLAGSIQTLGAGDFEGSFEMQDFYFAKSNGRMTSSNGEMRLDRSTDFYSASITGEIHMWDVEIETTFYITDIFTLDFAGYIYNGLYNYSVHLEGSDPSKVTTAQFKASIYLDNSSVEDAQSYLQGNLNSWLSSGLDSLAYLNDIKDTNSMKLELIQEVTCDPYVECPTSIYCVDQIDEICDQRDIIQNCKNGTRYGCNNIQMKCLDSKDICISDPNCTQNCSCLSTIKVCKKWGSFCEDDSSECVDAIMQKDLKNCKKSKMSCQTEEVPNKECSYECEYKNQVYSNEKKRYESFYAGYNKSYEDLVGFLELENLIESMNEMKDIIRVNQVYTDISVDQSGVGPYDFQFNVDLELVSLKQSNWTDYQVQFDWDFFNDDLNMQTLSQTSKSGVIDLSGEMFTQELSLKLPSEVIEENIFS